MQAGLGCVRLWVQAVLGGSEGVGAGTCGGEVRVWVQAGVGCVRVWVQAGVGGMRM